jgi:hypothetical protein
MTTYNPFSWMASVTAQLKAILAQGVKVASGLTDLNNNILALNQEWLTFLADVTAALQNDDPDAAVEQAAALVAAQTQAIQTADQTVTGTTPVTPPVTPPSS